MTHCTDVSCGIWKHGSRGQLETGEKIIKSCKMVGYIFNHRLTILINLVAFKCFIAKTLKSLYVCVIKNELCWK